MMVFEDGKQFKVNIHMMQQRLRPYLIATMEGALDELIKGMEQHVMDVSMVGRTGKGAPGDPSWRADLRDELQKVGIDYLGDVLEGKVGVAGPKLYQRVRALLIAYGSGSRSTKPGWDASPIMFGPEGRMVWDDELEHRHRSR